MAVADDLSPSAPDVEEDDLVRWLSLVERAAHSRGFGRPAQLVRFEPVDGGAAVAFHPLPEGAHPETALLGLTAPAGWPTLGVVADGGAVAVGEDGPAGRPAGLPGRAGTRAGSGPATGAAPRPPAGGRARRTQARGRRGAPGRRARVAVMAARSGLVVSLVRVDGDEPFTSVHRPRDPRPVGRLVDLLLRALGQPTAPPPASTVRLWAVVWLERALALAAGGRAPGWEELAALHPAVQIAGGGPPPAAGGGAPPSPAAVPPALRTGPDGVPPLVAVAAAAGRLVPWERLRAEAAAGRWAAPRLRPEEAAWMDAGAFARWVEGELPPLDALVRQATNALPRPVGRRVSDAVASWGLDAR